MPSNEKRIVKNIKDNSCLFLYIEIKKSSNSEILVNL